MRYLIFILFSSSLQAQSPLYRVEWNPDEIEEVENLLLDEYEGAAAAYSLRQLREDVTNVIRIREDGTNSEQDFSAEQITDGTLAAFCGNHNGFVITWYDQSGNNNHATQTTAANQPKIYDANTGLVMENGKPAIKTLFLSRLETSYTGLSEKTIILIGDLSNPLGYFGRGVSSKIGTGSTIDPELIFDQRFGNFRFIDGASSLTISVATDRQNLYYAGRNSSQLFLGVNGSSLTYGGTPNSNANTRNYSLFEDNTFLGNNKEYPNYVQEIIIYPSDQSPNREGIETNINSHYNIY